VATAGRETRYKEYQISLCSKELNEQLTIENDNGLPFILQPTNWNKYNRLRRMRNQK
jgi:hypothetical protein